MKLYPPGKYHYKQRLLVRPNDPLAYAGLGRAALGRQDPTQLLFYPEAEFGEVIRCYEKALALGIAAVDPTAHARALDALGHAYRHLGQYGKSNEYFSQKIDTYPEEAFWARYTIGLDCFEVLNEPRKAFQILIDALGSRDADRGYLHHVHSLLAGLSFYFGDRDNTARFARLAIESSTHPDQFTQRSYALLAQLKADINDMRAARRYIERADAVAGKRGANAGSLAFAYLRAKDYRKAIATATSAEPSTHWTYSLCLEALARAFLALNQTVGARQATKDYLTFVRSLVRQNIFVQRTRQEFERVENVLPNEEGKTPIIIQRLSRDSHN